MGVDEFKVDFPTLGDLWSAWMEQHCRVPDRHERGAPFREYDWQFWCTANHGRVREDATHDPGAPLLNQAFTFRRSQVIAPQKMGKGPWTAARVCVSAVGPAEFGGWAAAGDMYRCEDAGCGCGWEYEYLPGEPMGRRHPSPLIQIMATSDDQVANIWRPLVSMISLGPLRELLLPRGEFIRIVGESGDRDMDRIDRVTASAQSRLGAPINEAYFDESGLYTKSNKLIAVYETMRRGAAAMGGRSNETTNAPDPSMNSAAQQTLNSKRPDIFRYWRDPDRELRRPDGTKLSFKNARERRRILSYVYAGAAHINLDAIDAEAQELIETDPAQAERFFGNRMVQGLGSFMDSALWHARTEDRAVPDGTEVTAGFDGSRSGDWTALRLETADGFRFTPTYGPDKRPAVWNPAEWGGRIPRGEVNAAVAEVFARFRVVRMYVDPRHWETQADRWAEDHGDDVVVQWPTNQIGRMYMALVRYHEDLTEALTTHSVDEVAAEHAMNARKIAKPGDKYILGKPAEHQKIDVLMADVLAHEAAADMRALGWSADSTSSSQVMVLGW